MCSREGRKRDAILESRNYYGYNILGLESDRLDTPVGSFKECSGKRGIRKA